MKTNILSGSSLWVHCCLAIVLFAFLSACAGSKKSKYKRLPGTWQESKVTIDGSNKDWPSPYPEYDDKAMLGYCVSNDKDNLYITVETGDLATQMKILKNGLTVWIDKTGKKEETTAINFPLPQSYTKKDVDKDQKINNKSGDQSRPSSGGHWQDAQSNGGTDSKQKRRAAMEDRVRADVRNLDAYSLQGFKACNLEFPLLERDSCGIIVRLAIDDDNELVWEAVVPFKAFYYKKEISKLDKGHPMSICFETTGSKKPAGQSSGSHGGGGGGFRPSMGMGGMRMGMGGGGMHGGHGGSQTQADNEMESLYKSTKTYKVFGIAWVDKQ